MNKILFFTLLGALFSLSAQAQTAAKATDQLMFDVAYLASDLLEGRETGTRGEQLAAEYIARRFEQIGLTPKGSEGYFYSFDYKYSNNPHGSGGDTEQRTGKNVVGMIDNQAEYTIVIGAHYDHLGHGSFGSLHTDGPAIHNGADDNASGVAVILQLAERLKRLENPLYNFLIMGFSGEELGLYGSKNFVKSPTLGLDKISCMINLDMVGRLNEEKVLVINGVGTSPAWMEMLPKIDVHGITIKTTESGIGASDHTSFYLEDLPAIHFFTGQHAEYHKPTDDSNLINYEGMEQVADYIMALIQQLNAADKLVFSKTKDDSGRQAAAFKVSLGVMPDYTYQGEDGMRIDGVIDGRPGKEAGLEDGDIVIELGGVKVTDMYTYMDALSKFEKGDSTEVVVKRGKKKVTKTVKF